MFKFEFKKLTCTRNKEVQKVLLKYHSDDGVPVLITMDWDKTLIVKIRETTYKSSVDAAIALATIFMVKNKDNDYTKLQELVESFLAYCLGIEHKKMANLKPRLSVQLADKGRFKFERFGIVPGYYNRKMTDIKEMYVIFSSYSRFYKVGICKMRHAISISSVDGDNQTEFLRIPFTNYPDYCIVKEIGVFETLIKAIFNTIYNFIESNESLIKKLKN